MMIIYIDHVYSLSSSRLTKSKANIMEPSRINETSAKCIVRYYFVFVCQNEKLICVNIKCNLKSVHLGQLIKY